MDYDNLYCVVNAAEVEKGCYGYFANTLEDLKMALERKKSTLRVVYARLDHVLGECYERRFMMNCGNFSLFYKTDDTYNRKRH